MNSMRLKDFIKNQIAKVHLSATMVTITVGVLTAQNLEARNVDVTEFGALGDGTTLNTQALQKAIDTCNETGGGEVVVPPGTYYTGSIFLRSNVELHLCRGSVILGSYNNPRDYKERTLIMADGIENAGISGNGIICGNARHAEFQKRYKLNDGKRPYAVFYKDCKRMTLRDVEIRDAAGWTVRLFRCDGVIVEGISIFCLAMGNNDGIDVDARNVTITGCRIECDDDGICLKSDDPDFLPENITVTNCVIASNCNPIKFGTASWAGFRNVTISNCTIRPTTESNIWDWSNEYLRIAPKTKTGLAGIAIECVDGGIVENITCSNITMEGVITPIFICLNHRRMNYHTQKPGSIRNLQFSNIIAKAEGIIPTLIAGTPDTHIKDIVLRDIIVDHAGGETEMTEAVPENLQGYPENRMYGRKNPAGGLYIRHADNVIVENYQINQRNQDGRPPVYLDDAADIQIEKLKSSGSTAKLMIKTDQCAHVTLDGKKVK